MIVYFLFNVENENMCVVEDGAKVPLHTLDIDEMDNGYTNMSNILQTKLSILFVVSTIASLVYIEKVMTVI